MRDLNYLAIVAAALVAFVSSSVWYVVFNGQPADRSPGDAATKPKPWQIAVEMARSSVVATVLAWLATELAITTWGGSALLGLVMWIGFPVVLLLGSVIWEDVPWRLAATHAGDWLLKLLVISVIVGIWR